MSYSYSNQKLPKWWLPTSFAFSAIDSEGLLLTVIVDVCFLQVVICCVTERFCKSEMCQRELTLADNLRKPIIPVLFEFLDWPPAGQLALIFTKLLYIDMSQTPGAFPDNKLQELYHKVRGHVKRWCQWIARFSPVPPNTPAESSTDIQGFLKKRYRFVIWLDVDSRNSCDYHAIHKSGIFKVEPRPPLMNEWMPLC